MSNYSHWAAKTTSRSIYHPISTHHDPHLTPHPPPHPTQADHWIVPRCRDPMLSSVRTRQHASPGCGFNLPGGHNGHWRDAKQHKNTMTWNFKRKCWNKKATVFCLSRPLLLGGRRPNIPSPNLLHPQCLNAMSTAFQSVSSVSSTPRADHA